MTMNDVPISAMIFPRAMPVMIASFRAAAPVVTVRRTVLSFGRDFSSPLSCIYYDESSEGLQQQGRNIEYTPALARFQILRRA